MRSVWDLDFVLDLTIFRPKRCSLNERQRQGVTENWRTAPSRCGRSYGWRFGGTSPVAQWREKGEFVNMFIPSVNSNERCRRSMTRPMMRLAIAAMLLLAASAPRAQNAPQQAEKSDAAPSGTAEAGKKTFTKDGCYECHGREGQGAAQGAGPRIRQLYLYFQAFNKYG